MAGTDYDAAVEFARLNGSISVSNVAARQRVGIVFARAIVHQMVVQGLLEPVDNAGRYRFIGAGSQRGDESTGSSPDVPKTDAERVVDLEAQVTRLKSAGRTVIAQRDCWRSRAETAEAKLASLSDDRSSSKADQKFNQLKRFIAMEVHPDKVQGGFDKLVREAVFKMIWSKIEEIEKQ